MNLDFDDRQGVAFFGLLVGLGLGIPLLIVALLGIASGWDAILGGHPAHPIWGWLSSFHRDKHGHDIQEVGRLPILYWLSVVTAYIAYQFGELLTACFRLFRDAMVP